ncbi:MAG TPA: sugar phosphate nucleotidyltransferase [Polyangiaceae bacterium]|nr:sugar phosphate nucleotidyltransferase [Polyangiaceae bacterium]
MRIKKAIIPMGRPVHADLPLQHVTTADGGTKRVAALQIEELLEAGISQVALVTRPGGDRVFGELRGQFGNALVSIEQLEPRGFGDAVLCAESWVAGEPFVVQVCDHVFVTHAKASCTRQLVEAAEREGCAVSGVQVNAENQLPYFGVVGGNRVKGASRLYSVQTVIEKPTPTVAEERCMIAGLRQGTYLALFGTHALSPTVFQVLREQRDGLAPDGKLGLTEALDLLATREKYLALEVDGQRVDLESPFGLLRAQLALSLYGARREEVLRLILEEVALPPSERG